MNIAGCSFYNIFIGIFSDIKSHQLRTATGSGSALWIAANDGECSKGNWVSKFSNVQNSTHKSRFRFLDASGQKSLHRFNNIKLFLSASNHPKLRSTYWQQRDVDLQSTNVWEPVDFWQIICCWDLTEVYTLTQKCGGVATRNNPRNNETF
jgi:hypothetical protein